MNPYRPNPPALILAVLIALVAGCTNEDPRDTASTATVENADANANRAASFLLKEAPADARPVAEVRQNAKPGDVVVLTGRIGGTEEPFTQGFATFVVADEALEFCDELGGEDHCPMPWDACCEDPDKVAASRALVQIPGADSRPLRVGLAESGLLAPNDTVVVAGTVAVGSTPDNLIVDASGIYRAP